MSSRLSIQDMQRIARKHRGKCLSSKYIDAHTKLKWQCNKKHVWHATPNHIQNGTWCPVCGGTHKLNINMMRELAKSHRGKCLSKKYVDNQTKLKWKCKKGHIWSTIPAVVMRGAWCPYCAGLVKLSIKEMEAFAAKKGGKCLSKKYINSNLPLKWQCSEGHIWKATSSSIRAGRWCPYCSIGISERICRRIFERLFLCKFPKNRPLWLCNAKGNLMELDGYCKKLGVAFEYQGEQHYKNIKWFSTKICLNKRIKEDRYKKILCSKHKVKLICIPFNISHDKLEDYIKIKCKQSRIPIPNKGKVDVTTLNVASPRYLQEMQLIAKKRQGECLSSHYISSQVRLMWKCKKGHIWAATPNNIKRGKWCAICANVARLTLDQMRKIAQQRGGECLSKHYSNVESKLKWRCKKGHVWDAIPSNIMKGVWCPTCSGKPHLTIADMELLAKSHGGHCLSRRYINSHKSLKWKCDKGHQFNATPTSVQTGRWCKQCSMEQLADRKRLTIKDLMLTAHRKQGKCLSKVYINANSKMLWQCKRGHKWKATPGSVRSGTWCPKCARNRI